MTQHSDASLTTLVADKLRTEPNFMPQTLAQELDVPQLRIIEALPAPMRAEAVAADFVAIWEAMTEWEKVTFMATTSGAILEIPCRLPKGKAAHGMYNLMDKEYPLNGHLLMGKIASIWFVSKPVFSLESHSVQFYDAAGHECFAVYLGRDAARQILPSVKEGFLALKAQHTTDASH